MYLDIFINIDNIFEHMVYRIYSAELQLNKAHSSDTDAAFDYKNIGSLRKHAHAKYSNISRLNICSFSDEFF